jgi:hypothetical protein
MIDDGLRFPFALLLATLLFLGAVGVEGVGMWEW